MSIEDVRKYYSDLVKKEQIIQSDLRQKIFRVGTIRLLISILALCGVWYYWGSVGYIVGVLCLVIVLFLTFMRYHNKLYRQKKYCDMQIKNAQNELKGLDYDFSAFDGASEKIDVDHSFSLDLDLFGERSFFQSLNRSVTSFGKTILANALIHPLQDEKDIYRRQEAVKELQNNPQLLAHFRAIGGDLETDGLDEEKISASFVKTNLLWDKFIWKIMSFVIPLLYMLLGVLVYLNILHGSFFILLYVITFSISVIPQKKVSYLFNIFDRKSQVLEEYIALFKIVENQEFKSELLQEISNELKDKVSASVSINHLKSLCIKVLMSEVYPILLFLNPVLLWNVNYGMKLERWTNENLDNVRKWFGAIAYFDALVSLGIFAYNHPEYTFPQARKQFVFKGKALGHPMIRRQICVYNDIDISRSPFFMVVTGANMAGKSTYLRTVGLNHTLACAGAPVCAEELEFYPGKLVTNLRTADSLADNESYFFSELKRLKMIIDRLQSGEELFIILDEILKGTNSVDKQKGSLALIKQLVSLNGNGIIATHDLVLGQLEKEYPESVKNFRFEADITDDHLSFTYKMCEGIAENMNASFLMRKMGIIGV